MVSISVKWDEDDVRMQAKEDGFEITQEQVEEVLRLTKENHDANEGINWGVISYWIDDVVQS